MRCKLCESATEHFGELKILGSFDARYRRCTVCGFVCVEEATWLERAYSCAIAAADTGIVARNLKLADMTGLLIGLAFPRARRFLDFGGGAGLLVRMMRDRGFDFRLQDKYCANIFAGGFDARPDERFDMVTCMEVAEHMVDPLPAFRELGALVEGAAEQAIVVTTELLPKAANRPGQWWYYAPETGQHISFYTEAALHAIAERLRMRVASNGSNFHVFSTVPVSKRLLKMISSRRGRVLASVLVRLAGRTRRSLTQSDAEHARLAPPVF